MKSEKIMKAFPASQEVTFILALLLLAGTTSFAQQIEKVNNTEVKEFKKMGY